MIKNIIFDLDNTLIDWNNDFYINSVKNTCTDLNIKGNFEEILETVITAIDSYESNYDYFNIKDMVEALNFNNKYNFTEEFAKKLLYYFSTCVPQNIDCKILETLEYLKSKYNLVVLTNWFKAPQVERLRKTNLLHFFDEVYATETVKNKPNKEAFLSCLNGCEPHECVMIGDNFRNDYIGALDCGMNAIFYNRKKIKVDSNIVSIQNFEELKKLL